MATTRSNALGCGSASSWMRILRFSDMGRDPETRERKKVLAKAQRPQRKTGRVVFSGLCALCALARTFFFRPGHLGENGCFTLSLLAVIWSIFGSPFIARWMASLVAA